MYTEAKILNRQRRAGVLLHPTSLPSPLGNGDLGHQAYRFIEFLNANGFKVWQMLPLGVTGKDKSPYYCLSSHAGNPLLISLDWLEDKGWLNRNKISLSETEDDYRLSCLKQSFENFQLQVNDEWGTAIKEFTQENANWLDEYALFMALKTRYHNKCWYEWPKPIRHREAESMAEAKRELQADIKQKIFEQFVFYFQWQELRAYAEQHEVELFGDMPMFVPPDSVDVWAQNENFLINNDGELDYVAGVPPDFFSETGQLWGNPLYDWAYMQETNFSWWKERLATQLKFFDLIRVDHFRGLQACWQVPYQEKTAINGNWVEVPGREMLVELLATFHNLPLVAEDLGVITDPVIDLKNSFGIPGMKVLQFAFDGQNDNPHLPHLLKIGDTVYTGTHDNNTSLGWVGEINHDDKRYFEDYTGLKIEPDEEGVYSMIRLAMSSVSFLCVVPMQDILMLGSSARMNVPGTVEGNWQWRFQWEQIKPKVIDDLAHFITLYQR